MCVHTYILCISYVTDNILPLVSFPTICRILPVFPRHKYMNSELCKESLPFLFIFSYNYNPGLRPFNYFVCDTHLSFNSSETTEGDSDYLTRPPASWVLFNDPEQWVVQTQPVVEPFIPLASYELFGRTVYSHTVRGIHSEGGWGLTPSLSTEGRGLLRFTFSLLTPAGPPPS